jgi:hypothetical protein
MGMQKNITLDNTINMPEAYIKIGSFLMVPNSHIVINVNIYKDFAARQANKPTVVDFSHTCNGAQYFEYFSPSVMLQEGKCMLSQAYLWLKTLPFYSTAIDIDQVDRE